MKIIRIHKARLNTILKAYNKTYRVVIGFCKDCLRFKECDGLFLVSNCPVQRIEYILKENKL